MKLLLSALLLGLTLTACGPVEKEDADKAPDKIVNETDYSVCGSGNVGNTIVGSWRYYQSIGNIKFTKTYAFSRDYLRITNDCNFDGIQVRATASTRVMISMNGVSYLDSVLNENPVQREGYKLVCQSKIEPIDLNYRFQGNCLVLMAQDGKSSITLVPATTN
ncbi:hypothetical protein [Bdellovibrio sp. HCB209]|uniref:hypothetical protein n=1 Tax=Bdellovibrio sp. HCB209 TaxID=3394354 RepID=UPI0039B3F138